MSIDRTAYPRFKRVVSAQELAEAFTPTPDEIAWAREKTQNNPHLLALTVRLKAYQRLGYFPKLDGIPAVVVDTVRGVLDLPDGVTPQTDADRTAKRHRQFVREYLGVKYEAAKVRAFAEQAIRVAVQTKDNPADLINVALEELVRARCEVPGYTTLDAMAATIRAEVNGEFFAQVSGARRGPSGPGWTGCWWWTRRRGAASSSSGTQDLHRAHRPTARGCRRCSPEDHRPSQGCPRTAVHR